MPPRVMIKVLEHATMTTTQNIDAHVFDGATRHAAAVMNRVFSGLQNDAQGVWMSSLGVK